MSGERAYQIGERAGSPVLPIWNRQPGITNELDVPKLPKAGRLTLIPIQCHLAITTLVMADGSRLTADGSERTK